MEGVSSSEGGPKRVALECELGQSKLVRMVIVRTLAAILGKLDAETNKILIADQHHATERRH